MKCYEITFSPTGGTQKAADLLTKELSGECTAVDLTKQDADFSAAAFTAEDLAVIAVPSYGGRVPAVAVERLGTLKGNGARAVLVCVYGNRAYEDTLAELEDAAVQAGFRVIAAVAAIAEHSVVRRYAAGRTRKMKSSFRRLRPRSGRSSLPEMIQSPPFRGTVPIRRPVARGWCPSLAKGATTADFAPKSARYMPSIPRIPRIQIRTCVSPACGACPSAPSRPGRSTLSCWRQRI